ncbi:phosphopentomutase [Ruania zhangjianzhongii]|uniref:phosphopentomutase n=1 Tax=Ruania zhangjianzhongii TaxID=2603206 RepID=UPI0011C7DA77|nr:phosphopentomutase [Ruania zhangjianzhongii]
MSTTILVLDGFGIGALPDAGDLRPGDVRADTLGSLLAWSRDERRSTANIPWLTALGLAVLRPDLNLPAPQPAPAHLEVTARRSALGYPGADTFAGHQTMMGADMSHVTHCRVGERLEQVREALELIGHHTELLDGRAVILVDGQMLVHDNLEADPGLNWNVSAPLDKVRWEDLLHAAQAVRAVAPVARVIAVGGYADEPLPAYVRPGEDATIGLDTPTSGFYRNGGLQVRHLGAPLDHHRQLPEVAANAGLPVTLIGKAADILATEAAVERRPGVDTAAVLADTLEASGRPGLVITNVQQTDLSGHQQDPGRYLDLLEQVDVAIPDLLRALAPGEQFVVVADHGNDPRIGHAFHTREYVPVLAAARTTEPAIPVRRGDDLPSLADVGASVALSLGLGEHALGHGDAHHLTSSEPDPATRRTHA